MPSPPFLVPLQLRLAGLRTANLKEENARYADKMFRLKLAKLQLQEAHELCEQETQQLRSAVETKLTELRGKNEALAVGIGIHEEECARAKLEVCAREGVPGG